MQSWNIILECSAKDHICKIVARFLLTPIPRYQVSSNHLKSIYPAYLLSTNMGLLTCLLAVLSVVIASPVPDAELDFPSPLKGITCVSFGSYLPPPQNFGGNIASQDASVLGGNQDISTASGDLAPITQPDTLAHPMFESNGNLIAQSFSLAENYGSQNSNTPTPFQIYLSAECEGTRSVCCSGTEIDADEQPGVPLPCSDSMHFFFYLSFLQRQHKDLFVTKESRKMTEAGFWPGDTSLDRYCRRPVYPTDCNTVFVSFPFLLFLPFPLFFLFFSQIIHYYHHHHHHHHHRQFWTPILIHFTRPSIEPVAVSPTAKFRHKIKMDECTYIYTCIYSWACCKKTTFCTPPTNKFRALKGMVREKREEKGSGKTI